MLLVTIPWSFAETCVSLAGLVATQAMGAVYVLRLRRQLHQRGAEAVRIAGEQLPVAIFALDGEGNIVLANHLFARIRETQWGEQHHPKFLDNLAPRDRCSAEAALREAYQRHGATTFCFSGRDCVHTYKCMVTACNGIPGASLLCIIDDQTTRVEYDEQLRIAEERYRNLFERSAAPFCVIDTQGRYLEINPAYCEMVGYSRAELLQAGIKELMHPADASAEIAFLREQLLEMQSKPIHMEARRVRKDGRIIWVEISATVIRDTGQAAIYAIAYVRDITTRKEAEQRSLVSDRRFRDILETSGEAIVITDDRGKLLYSNLKFSELVGYTTGELELPDRTFDSFIASRGSHHSSNELQLIRKDGTAVWALCSTSSVTDPDGTRGVLRMMTDITQRRCAEEALKRSESRFRNLYDSDILGVVFGDGDGKVTAANRAFLEMARYSQAEVESGELNWNRLAPGHERAVADQARRDARSDVPRKTLEWEIVRRDGSILPAVIAGGMSSGHQASNGGWLAFVIDNTEKRLAEAALYETQRRYFELVENAQDLIYSVDETGRFVEANKATAKLSGYTREDLLGKNSLDFVTPEHRANAEAILTLDTSAGPQTYELQVRSKAGRLIWLEINVRKVPRLESAARFEVIGRDISERRELETRSRQTQKMEAIGRLAGGVAHDFNNLLTAIRGYSQLIQTQRREDAKLCGQVQEIIAASDRASALTQQLLAFSRRQMLQPRIVCLNDIVRSMEQMLRPLIGEHIDLHSYLDPALMMIKADPSQLEQLVMNLVVNSRDAMSNGGEIIITTTNVNIAGDLRGTQAGDRHASYVSLTISDTGVGMDRETQARVFEPFFSTKELGTGLGLSTVYGIVEQSGGTIALDSELGKGTTFTIRFPVEEMGLTESADHSKPMELPDGTETILIVEDEHGVRSVARRYLESCGYHVLEACNGAEALQVAIQHTGSIDVVVTDVVMPVMGGPELVGRLRKIRSMKVVYMSGYAEKYSSASELTDGASFVRKPFTLETLGAAVRRELNKKDRPDASCPPTE